MTSESAGQRATKHRWAIHVLLLGAAVAIWAALGTTVGGREVVSTPQDVARQLYDWIMGSGRRWDDLLATFKAATLGYALGVVAAVAAALAVASNRIIARIASPFLTLANALPKITLVPLFILWLGFGLQSQVAFVASAVFFIVFYNVVAGITGIDQGLLDNMRLQGASTRWRILQLYAPAAFGWLMSSLRLSVAWALLGAVAAEYLGSNVGIGHLISQGQARLDSTAVMAGVIVVALVAALVDRGLTLLERRYTTWRA